MHSNETAYWRFAGQNTYLYNGMLCAWVNSRQNIQSEPPVLHVNDVRCRGRMGYGRP